MKIKNFKLGLYETNCFLAWDENKTGYLFDCGGENLESLLSFVTENKINLKHILLTHGHFDHIGGLNKAKELFPMATLHVSEHEKEFLTNHELNLSELILKDKFSYNGEYKTVKDSDMVGDFKVIATPGHTAGSVCYYNKDFNILISGDTMFKESFGRTDLPTGDAKELFASLKKLCTILPRETVVYSAHTEESTIGEERMFLLSNRFI